MAWRAFQSRHLNGGEYDPVKEILTVQFVNGATYMYGGVPPTVADSLWQVSSPGTYFHSKIRGVYPEIKVASGITRAGRRSVMKRF